MTDNIEIKPLGFIKPDTDTHVYFYEQEFYVLSNFSAFQVEWKGHVFSTLEAAYHWEKFSTPVDVPLDEFSAPRRRVADLILASRSAHEAFQIAQEHKQYRRPDWDVVKVPIMRQLIRAKGTQHEYVRKKLLQTGSRIIVEDSWRDDFWGWGPNQDGRNELGKLWMEYRDELRISTSS